MSMVLEAASPINGTNSLASTNAAYPSLGERRRRPRAALNWQIHISRNGHSHLITTTSKNISSEGFYCLAQELFKPGECVTCTIFIPTQQAGKSEDTVCLRCHVRVLRVEPAAMSGTFGVACQIEDYTVSG